MPNTDYQYKRRNQYWMPEERYKMALAYARQYPRLCRMRDDLLHGAPNKADTASAPKGVKSDPTAQRGINLAKIDDALSVIDKALAKLPQEYRQAILDNVLFKLPSWHVAGKYHIGEATVRRWRARFLWEVAEGAKIP